MTVAVPPDVVNIEEWAEREGHRIELGTTGDRDIEVGYWPGHYEVACGNSLAMDADPDDLVVFCQVCGGCNAYITPAAIEVFKAAVARLALAADKPWAGCDYVSVTTNRVPSENELAALTAAVKDLPTGRRHP